MKYLFENMKDIERRGNYPLTDTISSALGSRVTIQGKEFLLFSSNSYLGLTTNSRLIDASVKAIKQYGTGSGASRVVSGTFEIHSDLELEIAKFKEVDTAMVLTSGYSTNVSLIPALVNVLTFQEKRIIPKTIIFSDQYNHASIIDGIRLSGARVIVYPHSNLQFLEDSLKVHPESRKIIITDSVFSMDGDLASLDKIVELKRKYNASLLIDEAHATGVIGSSGRGAANLYKVTKEVDITMGTLSKAIGSIGAYIGGKSEVIKLLKVSVRGYVFSTALPPGDVAVSREAIKLLVENPGWGEKLLKKAKYLRDKLNEMGFSTLGSQTQIVPILIGDELRALKFQIELKRRRIIASCIQWPAVEKKMSRIRFSLMLSHTKGDLDRLLGACKEIKEQMGL